MKKKEDKSVYIENLLYKIDLDKNGEGIISNNFYNIVRLLDWRGEYTYKYCKDSYVISIIKIVPPYCSKTYFEIKQMNGKVVLFEDEERFGSFKEAQDFALYYLSREYRFVKWVKSLFKRRK